MSERVDELFGAGGSAARPRTALTVGLLFAGVAASGLGLACSVVPGALVVLLAWVVVQRDLDRVDSGFLPVVERPGLLVVRAFVVLAVMGAAALTVVQLWLTWQGFYDAVWPALVAAWLGVPFR